MTVVTTCRGCGKALPADAPQELCPSCLMAVAMDAASGVRSGVPGGSHAPFIPPPPDEFAKLINGLEVTGLIGRGGMGAVYRARQPNLDRPAALKVLPPSLAADPLFAERFEREAKTLARLGHQHIVAVYDFGRAGPFFYILMEFVDGPNLRELLARPEPLPVERSLAIAAQVCAALQYAHEEGIVHRDVKPANVLIDPKGRAKIVDFGLARLLAVNPAAPATLTASSITLGTPVYMAPEQIAGAEVDHRADLYAAGVVLYELLTRQLPLGHFAPASCTAGVDVRLDRIIAKALEPDAAKRYQSAGEMEADIQRVRRGLLVPDYAVFGAKLSRARVWHWARLAGEWLVLLVALLLIVPLRTGIPGRWQPIMEPVTFFNGMEPVFGLFWLAYLGAMLMLGTALLALRWWLRWRISFAAGCLLVLAAFMAAGYRHWANPLVQSAKMPGATGYVQYEGGNNLLIGMRTGEIHACDPFAQGVMQQVRSKFSGAAHFRINEPRDRVTVLLSDNILELIEWPSGRSIATIKTAMNTPPAAAFSPDGLRFAVVVPAVHDSQTRTWRREQDTSLFIYSAFDGALISREKTPPLSPYRQAIDWSGDLIAVSDCYDSNGRGVLLYDAAAHQIRANVVHPEFQSGPLSVELSPDAATLAVGYAPWDVALWDTASAKLLHNLQSRNNWVVCLDFSPDGRLLASGEGNSAVRVWGVRTGKQLHHFGMGPQNASNYTYSVSFMKAGDLLACGTEDQHVVVWRIPELSR